MMDIKITVEVDKYVAASKHQITDQNRGTIKEDIATFLASNLTEDRSTNPAQMYLRRAILGTVDYMVEREGRDPYGPTTPTQKGP